MFLYLSDHKLLLILVFYHNETVEHLFYDESRFVLGAKTYLICVQI